MNKIKMGAEGFNRIASEIFAPIYPVIAEQICESTGITSGLCLDLGAGTGLLGIALAHKYDLNVILYDIDDKMLEFAAKNISGNNLGSKVSVMQGDAGDIKLDDNSIDLIVSRGSVFFWNNKPRCFREIYRVLKEGGRAVIGGGFGNSKLAGEIDIKMLEVNENWKEDKKRRMEGCNAANLKESLAEAGLEPVSNLCQDERGLWINIIK